MPISYTTNLVNIFTLMMSTPLVDPKSMARPTVIPLKTFRWSCGPSLDYSHQSMVRILGISPSWNDIRTFSSPHGGSIVVTPASVHTAVVPLHCKRAATKVGVNVLRTFFIITLTIGLKVLIHKWSFKPPHFSEMINEGGAAELRIALIICMLPRPGLKFKLYLVYF